MCDFQGVLTEIEAIQDTKSDDQQLPSVTSYLSKLIPSLVIDLINSSVKEQMKQTRSKGVPYLIMTCAR